MFYYVYIATNHSRTLYTGVTNDLRRRASEHRAGVGSTFTMKYRCDTIVWFAEFRDVNEAIATEKKIKGGSRARKIALIEKDNPQWASLVD